MNKDGQSNKTSGRVEDFLTHQIANYTASGRAGEFHWCRSFSSFQTVPSTCTAYKCEVSGRIFVCCWWSALLIAFLAISTTIFFNFGNVFRAFILAVCLISSSLVISVYWWQGKTLYSIGYGVCNTLTNILIPIIVLTYSLFTVFKVVLRRHLDILIDGRYKASWGQIQMNQIL